MAERSGNPLALGLVLVGAAALAIAAFLPLDEPTGIIPHRSRGRKFLALEGHLLPLCRNGSRRVTIRWYGGGLGPPAISLAELQIDEPVAVWLSRYVALSALAADRSASLMVLSADHAPQSAGLAELPLTSLQNGNMLSAPAMLTSSPRPPSVSCNSTMLPR